MDSRAGRGLARIVAAITTITACRAVDETEATRSPAPSTATGTVARDSELPPIVWLAGPEVRRSAEHPIPLGHYLGPGAVYALGDLAGSAGLVTFDDGELWISRAAGGSIRTQRFRAGDPLDVSARPLLLARVEAWRDAGPLPDRSSLDTLFEEVARRLGSRGVTIFRVDGDFEAVRLHVPGLPLDRARRIPAARGHLVGVSGEAASQVLLGRRAPGVVHLTSDDPVVTSGRVSSVWVAPGARLKLPETSTAAPRRP